MRAIALILVCVFCVAPASQPVMSSFLQQDMMDLVDEMGQVWKPAYTPPGAIDWRTITNVKVEEKLVDNMYQYIPTFSEEVKALDKTTVKLNGYMIPLDATEEQTHFILMAYPHSCPFHMPGGPAGFVEIKADFPVKFSYDPVLIEGQFQILTDFSDGLFYRIAAARAVN